MTEYFLHYLWQFQYFDRTDLRTTAGDEIVVLHQGVRNVHSGPDFSNARLRIGPIEWVGNVEIHIFASGWIDHKHDHDPAYDNVVLHVVWKNDRLVDRPDGTTMPTLQLLGRVASGLILRYHTLAQDPALTPCAAQLQHVGRNVKENMLQRSALERLEVKADNIIRLLERNNGDWEEAFYQALLRNFGFKVNTEPFLQLAQALPYKTLMKHADKLNQIEALMFGQAGMLNDTQGDAYYQMLRREYVLLGQKYRLWPKSVSKVQWRFLRLRPANFPTIRIAQASVLLYHRRHIFSSLLALRDLQALRTFFHVRQSEYWMHHYLFGGDDKDDVPGPGQASIDNIIINSVVPMLVAYGKTHGDSDYLQSGVRILQAMQPESNLIVNRWKSFQIESRHALDSQALVQLSSQYCAKRRCLECLIGSAILNPSHA